MLSFCVSEFGGNLTGPGVTIAVPRAKNPGRRQKGVFESFGGTLTSHQADGNQGDAKPIKMPSRDSLFYGFGGFCRSEFRA
jgi:hypothetical protein